MEMEIKYISVCNDGFSLTLLCSALHWWNSLCFSRLNSIELQPLWIHFSMSTCWKWNLSFVLLLLTMRVRERVLYVMAYANTVNVRETVKIRDEDEVAEVEDWAGAGGRTSSSYSNSSWSDGDVTRVFNGTENQQQTAIRKDANRISAKDKIHSSVSCFNIPFHSTLCVRLCECVYSVFTLHQIETCLEIILPFNFISSVVPWWWLLRRYLSRASVSIVVRSFISFWFVTHFIAPTLSPSASRVDGSHHYRK